MNKAFVKEPEDHGDHCPECGSLGSAVRQATLAAMLSPEDVSRLSEAAHFCPLPTCDVSYFDGFERTVPTARLKQPVYPKNPSAAICPCFGLTCDDIEVAAQTGDVSQLKEHLQRARSVEARCETKSPTGEPCVAEVQKCYMRARGQP
ncbi:MAG: hypothetical protein O3A00_08480 [Planctomycetota bacterium]|nr:hypothetical protein [Planctomycetota bacterium]